MELQFLFSAHCLILVYFCTQFHEISLMLIKLQSHTIFILIISKGLNSAKNVDELLFFFSPHHPHFLFVPSLMSDGGLYLYKVS